MLRAVATATPRRGQPAGSCGGNQAHGATDGMVLLDGGEFLMGSDDRDGFAADGEGPVRRVDLRPFWARGSNTPDSSAGNMGFRVTRDAWAARRPVASGPRTW